MDELFGGSQEDEDADEDGDDDEDEDEEVDTDPGSPIHPAQSLAREDPSSAQLPSM